MYSFGVLILEISPNFGSSFFPNGIGDKIMHFGLMIVVRVIHSSEKIHSLSMEDISLHSQSNFITLLHLTPGLP